MDIVVLSNIKKDVGQETELLVGMPNKDPWSLPFAHKQVFADRLNNYDLFLYSEDDVLVTEKNIRAFLRAVDVLPENEIPDLSGLKRVQVKQIILRSTAIFTGTRPR